jgi:rfaE bifunctional protein kinase chain/domain
MNRARFDTLTAAYHRLRLGIVGDFCLDRYLEIDPARQEHSLETGLPVHNIVHVRSQPGAAGTILNNLIALGIGTLYPVGFVGEDAEGHDLGAALATHAAVRLDHFLRTPLRRTFCYTKPLLLHPGQPPQELSRFDFKNWSPTPETLAAQLASAARQLAPHVDALIVLDQVDVAETGVVTAPVRDALGTVARDHPELFMIADSRRGLRGYPPLSYKMNAREFTAFTETSADASLADLQTIAAQLADHVRRPVFVTLAERGILGAAPGQPPVHLPALPCCDTIDVVGAGDAVTANLAAAFAAGAQLDEALELANAAASIVIHKVGTTGTASVPELARCLGLEAI